MSDKKIRRILTIDGGGIRGIIPAAVTDQIARTSGKECWQIFDLITGTSTGSILGGMLAAGVPAASAYNMYVKEGAKLFTKNAWYKRLVGGPKYRRDELQDTIKHMIKTYGQGIQMKDMRTKFASTTFNGCSNRTHYQLSWNPYHGTFKIVDVLSWSGLSAVHYFSPICVPDYRYKLAYQVSKPIDVKGAVFFDGGQGRNNCTLLEAMTTARKLGWLGNDEVHILSLGTGATPLYKPYVEAKDRGKVMRIKDYLSQAENEAVHDQLHKAQTIEKCTPGLKIYRLDAVIKDSEDKLDALDKVPELAAHGRKLRDDVPRIFTDVQ